MATSVKPTFEFDEAGDVLYISLSTTHEPSYCEEMDDILLVERGMYSDELIGFRILDVKNHGIKEVAVEIKKAIPKIFRRERRQVQQKLKDMEVIPAALIKEAGHSIKELIHEGA